MVLVLGYGTWYMVAIGNQGPVLYAVLNTSLDPFNAYKLASSRTRISRHETTAALAETLPAHLASH